jgi:hypothetical protein
MGIFAISSPIFKVGRLISGSFIKLWLNIECGDHRRGLNKPPALIPIPGSGSALVITKGDPVNLKFRISGV